MLSLQVSSRDVLITESGSPRLQPDISGDLLRNAANSNAQEPVFTTVASTMCAASPAAPVARMGTTDGHTGGPGISVRCSGTPVVHAVAAKAGHGRQKCASLAANHPATPTSDRQNALFLPEDVSPGSQVDRYTYAPSMLTRPLLRAVTQTVHP
jgi:hypothetical protein